MLMKVYLFYYERNSASHTIFKDFYEILVLLGVVFGVVCFHLPSGVVGDVSAVSSGAGSTDSSNTETKSGGL